MDEKTLCLRLEQYSDDLQRLVSRRIPHGLKALLSADDVLQEVWLTAHRQLPQFAAGSDQALYRWLSQITIGITVDLVRTHLSAKRGGQRLSRRSSNRSSLPELIHLATAPTHTPSSEVARNESIGLIRDALATLEEPYKSMLRMRFFEGASDEEISQEMNLTLGTVRGAIYRTVQRIREDHRPERSFSDA